MGMGPAAMVAGGAMGMINARNQNRRLRDAGAQPQQVVQQEPWAPQRPHLERIFTDAQRQYERNPITLYPNKLVADIAPESEEYLQAARQEGLSGSAERAAALPQLEATLRGDYLYGGPAFNAALQAAERQILPGIQSRYARGGRFASGLGRAAEAQALADAFAGQYGQERQRQMEALRFAPELGKQRQRELAQLAAAGARREAQQQEEIDEAIQRFEFQRDQPDMRLRRYADFVRGGYGGTRQSFGPAGQPGSRAAGALGGALAAAQLFGGIK